MEDEKLEACARITRIGAACNVVLAAVKVGSSLPSEHQPSDYLIPEPKLLPTRADICWVLRWELCPDGRRCCIIVGPCLRSVSQFSSSLHLSSPPFTLISSPSWFLLLAACP